MYYPSLFRKKKNELLFWTTCGPATTFDPKINGVAGTWFFDDGTTLDAAGVEISKTFATDGLHRAVFRPASGGLAAITAIDCNIDLVTRISGLVNCRGLTGNCWLYINSELVVSVYDVPRVCGFTHLQSTLAYGPVSGLPDSVSVYISKCSRIVGNIADFGPSLVDLRADSVPLSGSIADFANKLIQKFYLYSDTSVTAGSIAEYVDLRDARIYNMGWLTADVDTVIDSMWAARANYTYATPTLTIGGTNQAPTGNVTAPVEGADWHQDGATWIPLTAGAKAYDLAKNVNGEARTATWTITYSGGSIAP